MIVASEPGIRRLRGIAFFVFCFSRCFERFILPWTISDASEKTGTIRAGDHPWRPVADAVALVDGGLYENLGWASVGDHDPVAAAGEQSLLDRPFWVTPTARHTPMTSVGRDHVPATMWTTFSRARQGAGIRPSQKPPQETPKANESSFAAAVGCSRPPLDLGALLSRVGGALLPLPLLLCRGRGVWIVRKHVPFLRHHLLGGYAQALALLALPAQLVCCRFPCREPGRRWRERPLAGVRPPCSGPRAARRSATAFNGYLKRTRNLTYSVPELQLPEQFRWR